MNNLLKITILILSLAFVSCAGVQMEYNTKDGFSIQPIFKRVYVSPEWKLIEGDK